MEPFLLAAGARAPHEIAGALAVPATTTGAPRTRAATRVALRFRWGEMPRLVVVAIVARRIGDLAVGGRAAVIGRRVPGVALELPVERLAIEAEHLRRERLVAADGLDD